MESSSNDDDLVRLRTSRDSLSRSVSRRLAERENNKVSQGKYFVLLSDDSRNVGDVSTVSQGGASRWTVGSPHTSSGPMDRSNPVDCIDVTQPDDNSSFHSVCRPANMNDSLCLRVGPARSACP